MNHVVNSMVELLFRNTEESAEVRALREELLANCEEHYQDLISRGVSEQEALSAVAESLQGMEEVVSQYPAKNEIAVTAQPEPEKMAEAPVWRDAREIRVDVKEWDVCIIPSANGRVNVHADGEHADQIDINFENGVLTVKDKNVVREPEDIFARLQKLNWNSFDGLIRSVRDTVNSVISSCGGTITIEIPCAVEKITHHSASGDLKLEGIVVRELISNTASGDVDAAPVDTGNAVHVHTASGDVHVTAQARTIELESMSGDVSAAGLCEQLKISTVSGDVTCNCKSPVLHLSSVSGDVRVVCENTFVNEATLQSTSGDVHFELHNGALRSLSGKTVSGDVSVMLPADLQPAHIVTETLNGDSVTNIEDSGAGAPVNVFVKTLSGDISIRKN